MNGLVYVKVGEREKKLRQDDKCTTLEHQTSLQLYYNTNVCLLRQNKQTNQPCLLFNPVGDNHTQTQREKERETETLLQIMLRCNLSICLINSKIQAA